MSAASANPQEDAVRTITSTTVDGAGDGPIALVDHTKSAEEDEEVLDPDRELTHTLSTLSQKLTKDSLRQITQRRNYKRSRWQEGGGRGPRSKDIREESAQSGDAQASADTQESPPVDHGEDQDTWGEGRVRRSRRKVKGLIKTPKKKAKSVEDADSHVDILYENQRGFFFVGIPHFSSKSLVNFDPSPWLNSVFHPSAVDITDAQVPDPSWEWAWRTWYVDMSHDVDEEGWEYSFWFRKKASWHGTHPWFHSFVRRRRWLRKRVRKQERGAVDKSFGEGHMLNADYFTIHSQPRPRSISSDVDSSIKRSTSVPERKWGASSWKDQEEDIEVQDIPALMKHIRESTIDREKMVVVQRFLDSGGDELYYLAEKMPEIMSLFVFQSSRLLLLSDLRHRFHAATKHRDKHQQRGEPEDDQEKKNIDNLLNAVNAADEQCKRLEFWSDVRTIDQQGVMGGADHSHRYKHEWMAGSKNSTSEDTTASVEDSNTQGEVTKAVKGKGKAKAKEDTEPEDMVSSNDWVVGSDEKQDLGGPSQTSADDEEEDSKQSSDAATLTGKEDDGSGTKNEKNTQKISLPTEKSDTQRAGGDDIVIPPDKQSG